VKDLQRTPLHATHVRLGGRMVEFAGFEMPVQYSSILAEHAAVRSRSGIFDVSHMGQIHFSGPEAVAAVERLLSCKVASLKPGRVRYGLMCNEAGGVVDDVTVYRQAPDSLFLCVNAANIEKDFEWIRTHSPKNAGVSNRSDQTGLLALQGPRSAALLEPQCDAPLSALGRLQFGEMQVAGAKALVSRTGYAGGDGCEIYLGSADTTRVFDSLMEAQGTAEPATPIGLGARDTLRLEAALPLYGHELDADTSPLAAGLERFLDLEIGGFIGADAILRDRDAGLESRLVGFALQDRGVARAGCAVALAGKTIGRVTSAGPSPTLGKSTGLAYVPTELAEPGSQFQVLVRERALQARVVDTPFV